jgi:prolipoprotein diacylglyceryltransferase
MKEKPEFWVKVFTCIGFGFLIFNVIWYWFISDEHNASGIILSFYVLFFAAIIFMCRVLKKPRRLLDTFVFMKTKIGPGVFIIFCGCIS